MASNTDPNLNHPLAQPNPHRVILGPQPYPGPSSIVSALLSTATQSPAQRDLLALYASGLNSPLNPLESPQAYMNSPSGGTSPLSAAGPLAALLGGSTNTSAQSNLSSLASQVGAQSCQPLPIMEVSSAGLTALALHSVVVVTTAVPPVRVITTLDEHVTLITALAWSHHVLNLESDRTSLLQLASGDLQGNLIVWNVAQPHTQLTRFSGAELKLGAVLDVQWMRARHARHLVAAVHYPNHLVMYNTLTSSVVWKIELPDPIISLHLNPFDAQQACLATPHGGIFVVKDFKVDAAPRLVELKYKINSQGSDATLKSDYVQMCFSPHHRHIVFFLLEKRILVFDLSLNQSVAVMLLDRNRPALKQLCLSSHSPNLLFCLHEENLVTAWKRRDSSDTYQFELCASLDLTRHNKTAKKKSSLIYSMALSPLSDRYLFVTSSDGSVMAVEWRDEDEGVMRNSVLSAPFDLYAPQFSAQSVSVKRVKCELRVVSVLDSGMTALTQLSVAQQPSHHCRINTIGVHLNTGMLAAGLDNGLLLIYGPSDFVPRHTFQLFTPSTVTAAGANDALANNVSVRGVRWLDEHRVISFSSTCVDKGLYVNRIVLSDIRTGQHTDIRKKTDPENTYIRGIRPSPAKSYLIVLLKDQPFQIWSLKTYTLLRTLKPYVQITAIEWAPSTAAPSLADKSAALDLLAAHSLTAYSTPPVTAFDSHALEQFVFASPDGSLKCFKVDSSVVTAAPLSVETGPSNNVSSALAMKERYLVTGDTLGTIHVHNLDTPGKSSTYQTNKGVIRRVKFSPASNAHQIVVLFNDGEFGVWDIDRNTRVSLSTALRQRNLRAVDVDWLSEHQLVIATSDGCMRVMDKNMTTTNSALTWHGTRDRLAASARDQLSRGRVQSPLIARVNQPLPTHPSPLLLSPDQAMRLKTALLHGEAHLTAELRALVDPELVLALNALHAPSQPLISDTAARALLVAKYFGNLDEIRFWTLVLYFMEKVLLNKEYYSTDRARDEVEGKEMLHPHWSLPECYDLLRDNEDLKRTHLFLAHLHTKKRNATAPYEMTKKMGDHLLLLGEKDKAIELLLETNPQHPQYYQNLLKSCLIAASQSAEHLKNTVKLVSSQLIAEGMIDEGVQLLSLMPADPLVPAPSPQLQASKGVRDAARYLQSYDRWTDAAWLVKLHYPSHAPQCREVLMRWAHYLFTVQQHQLALELYLSLGMFTHALQVLHKAELYDLAALLVRACEETGLDTLLAETTTTRVEDTEGTAVAALTSATAQISLHDTSQIEPSNAPAPSHVSSNSNPERSVPFAQLKEMIYVEYGYHLKRFGSELVSEYWMQGGAVGQEKLANEAM